MVVVEVDLGVVVVLDSVVDSEALLEEAWVSVEAEVVWALEEGRTQLRNLTNTFAMQVLWSQ